MFHSGYNKYSTISLNNNLCCACSLVMPITTSSRSHPMSLHMLEGPGSNHGYWQTKGPLWFNGHSNGHSLWFFHPSSLSSLAAVWLVLSPSLSQPIWFPASGWVEAQLSVGFLWCVNDKEMQWEALNHSVWKSAFETYHVLFFMSRPCKSPSTPSMTSLLPCALTPFTSSHSAAQPSVLPYSVKKVCFPTIPWRVVSAFYFQKTEWFIEGTIHPRAYFCRFNSDTSLWPYGSGNTKIWR